MRLKMIALSALLAVTGCSSLPTVTTDVDKLDIAKSWQQPTQAFSDQWLESMISNELKPYLLKALQSNHQLQQRRLGLAAAEQNLTVSSANFWPSLSTDLNSSRRKSQPADSLSTSNTLSVDLRYELDLWGKLSDSDRQVNLQYQSQKLQFEQFRTDLLVQIISNWFSIIEAQQQLELNQKRLENEKQNLTIIESGYESGLNSALDVYLARNSVANEIARVSSQRNTLLQNTRSFELLMADYPAGDFVVTEKDIPTIAASNEFGLPSEIISRKAENQAVWLSVLAKDADVAYRYKQRFPSLTLSAGLSKSDSSLGDLLSNNLAWSLVSSLSVTLFDAGKLAANQKKAELELQQTEFQYLETLFSSFSEVENALSSEASLQANYTANLSAEENALLAESLSFEQYQKGLVSYTTVLDAQTRAFNAQSTVIQLKFQLLNNRLKLYSALGGNFEFMLTEKGQ